MSDSSAQPPGGGGPRDPWAPPERTVPLDKPARTPHVQDQPPVRPVYDQPTVTAIPGAAPPGAPVPAPFPGPGQAGQAPGAVPPPPTAPGGPAPAPTGPYGYPGAPAAPQHTGAGYPGYPGYGYPGYGHTGWQPPAANGMGVAAMTLGILSICLFCVYGIVGVILGTLAVIFGVVGRKRAERGEATNAGQALSGIITGTIGIVLGAITMGLIIWGITDAINNEDDDFDYDSGIDDYSAILLVDAGR
ncbi:DUF4190 domain-containing protein [Streptomyces sp. NBC_01498]|uniref:DUF4190 domain-containing protein n=1 Tax=Streptomyces sp. NBC_01498 TaxID=2975870 RepID=UPI002E7B8064|nr:DUF4190 domain-containing protein [Streptomyces sp. NBC_01498]WTL24371.1 DUF4190 domain-containing protein [Streptomyces sp. NBC_01498]